MDILDIVCQPRHQSAYRIPIEKGDGEILEVGKEFHPEAMHHPLPRHLHGIDLEEIQTEMDDQNGQDNEGNVKNPRHISPPQDEEVLPLHLFQVLKGNEPARTAPFEQGRILS